MNDKIANVLPVKTLFRIANRNLQILGQGNIILAERSNQVRTRVEEILYDKNSETALLPSPRNMASL